MREPPYLLDAPRRWGLQACHVRTNHVHVIVTAETAPEKVMSDFKAYASRRLRERLGESADCKRWTHHGSTRYLWKPESVGAAIQYVVREQGEPMAVWEQPKAMARLQNVL